jgi:NADH-quinone oxidoreductase subunit B
LKESIGKENRPLSWTTGDQGVNKPEKPIIRDLMNERRMAATKLKSPDEI